MDPLQPSMFVPPEVPDWIPGSYQRIAAGKPSDLHYAEACNWMSRLLRIPDDAAEFSHAHHNEADLVNEKLHCVVDPKTKLPWLYSSVGEKVCYLAGRYKIESVEQMQAKNPSAASPRMGNPRMKLIVVTGLHDFPIRIWMCARYRRIRGIAVRPSRWRLASTASSTSVIAIIERKESHATFMTARRVRLLQNRAGRPRFTVTTLSMAMATSTRAEHTGMTRKRWRSKSTRWTTRASQIFCQW